MASRPALVTLLLIAGCSSASTLPLGDAGADGAVVADVATPGEAAGGMCTDLVNDAPVIHLSCPYGTDCKDCPPGGATDAIADGTYVAAEITLYASGCGIFANDPVQATLRVHGSTMELVSSGPVLSDGRVTLSYAIANGKITYTALCPADEGGVGFGTDFRAWPDRLFLTHLPGVAGPAVFVRR